MLIMSVDEVKTLDKKVDKILNYLYNDSGTGQKGLIAKVEDMHTVMNKFIENYEKDQAVKKARLGVIGAVAGGIGAGLLWVIEQIVKHIHF